MRADDTETAAYDFHGRTAIVTGAARGIGEAVVTALTGSGADVLAVDHDEDALLASASASQATLVAADVTRTADVESVVATAINLTGRIDILINNAGILRDAVLWKLDDADWNAVLDVHLGGTFKFTRACVPHFRAQRFGRVVNVTSYTGLHGNRGQAAYAAAKAGIIGFTKTAAKELAAFAVTVNAISPNAETRMVESIPSGKRAELESMIPLQRFGDPKEIVAAVNFLASNEASYVTGIVLPVDGGLSM
jgi:3-oxoacyl-[acyl-carrier protein] reductase